jgi:ribosomal protein L7Ae-like RNA K-turn-binding protein
VTAAGERKLLGLLGLGLRARTVVVGVEQVRNAAKRGTLYGVVIAPDASRHSLDKVLPLLQAKRVPVIEGPSASVLGGAVGREATAAVGIIDRDLARGIRGIVG